jgi:hypothetical protein
MVATRVAAFMLSQQLPIRQSERQLRKMLRPAFASYLDGLRNLAKSNADARLQRRFRDHSNALRNKTAPLIRRSSVYEAQASYNDTIDALKKLGEEADKKSLDPDQRKEVLAQADDLIKKRFEPLPNRMLNRLADLRSDRDLRPLARGLADQLARDASTLARVEGERIANEEQGTGWWQWVTVGDHKVRRTHKLMRGQKRRIGTQFSNGVRYPRDPTGRAEEVINCRCHTRPVRGPRR